MCEKNYNSKIARLKAKKYISKVKAGFKKGTMNHANVSIVLENKSGTDVKFGKALKKTQKK